MAEPGSRSRRSCRRTRSRKRNTAILNLDNNATGLWSAQEYGRLEGLRLAETLKLVAGAYDLVDINAMEDIKNGGQGTSPPEVPGVNKLPEPPLPAALAPPQGQLVDDGLMVPDVQTNLLAGDQAASLRAAAAAWRQNAASLQTAAEGFEISTVNWEGEAAKAAYRKFNDYQRMVERPFEQVEQAWRTRPTASPRPTSTR